MANSLPWTPTSTPPALGQHELHVWRAALNVSPALTCRLESALNEDEKGRAEKFLVPQARDRFVASRGILRELLATYLEIEPEKVEFMYGPQGKPSLSPVYNSKVCFNISHSREMGLFAFASDAAVGVDIEQVKPDFKGMEIASRFFSSEEIAALAKLPPELGVEAFFECWTRKEAYVKARGQGLGIPLRSFTVSFAASEQLLRDETGAGWSCCALEPAPGFAGAVVAVGENWSLKCWEWSARVESFDRPGTKTSV
jgi:4'-phosphopantetheinyl transferase